MSAPEVRIRLVPKNRDGGTIPVSLFEAVPAAAKAGAPDAGRARAALAAAWNLGIPTELSPRNALDGVAPVDKVEKAFGCTLEEVSGRGPENLPTVTTVGTFYQPTGELKVPPALAGNVAFAYVPTPPQFYAQHFAPPPTDLYHLRLEDVARVLRAYRCHRHGWTGRRVRIAMTDTGFAPLPFFEDYGFDIQRVHTSSIVFPGQDLSGHGTGESANALVVAPDCAFVGVKHDDYAALALETALAQRPRIVNNSWGWDVDHQSMNMLQGTNPNLYNELRDVANIIADAVADGVTMIFAGGNGHKPFPACLPEVLAIGGVTVLPDGDLKASNYASSFASQLYPGRRVPDFCGVVGEAGPIPQGGHIMLPVPNGSALEGVNLPPGLGNRGWGVFSGTSAAAPQTAGVTALMLSVHADLRPTEIKSILAATARDVVQGVSAHGDPAGPGVDPATGSGFIDAFAACLRVWQVYRTP